MKKEADEIKAQFQDKIRTSSDSDGLTEFERENRHFAAAHTLTPHIQAYRALDRILGNELHFVSELNDWVNPYDDDYLENLAYDLEISITDNLSDAEVIAARKNYDNGKKYMEHRTRVSQIFYHEVATALSGKESVLLISTSPNTTSIQSTLLIKNSVFEWARNKLTIDIPEWSLEITEKPINHLAPEVIEAQNQTKKARISNHITIAVLAKMLGKYNKSMFVNDPPIIEGPLDYNSTGIAEEAQEIFKATLDNLGVAKDAPIRRGQAQKTIIKRLDLARDIFNKEKSRY